MKYNTLIFDADDTLFDFSYAEKLAIKQIIISRIDKKEFEKYFQIYKEVNRQVWSEREQNLITFDELKSERFRRFFDLTGLKLNAIQAGKEYLTNLSKVTKLMPFAYYVIRKLSKDFTIAILTNGLTSVQKPRLFNSSIYNFVNVIVISEEVGFSKPESGIFEILCKKIGYYDKTKMLMIGDNYFSDILGGIKFGIDTCWITQNQYEINKIPNFIPPTYLINSILEIPKLFYR